MIILIVYENCVLAFKCKYKPPISADVHRPMSLKVPAEWMQSVTRSIHIRRLAGSIQCSEQNSKFPRMRGLNTRLRSGFGKKLQTLMPVASDHAYSV